MAGYQIIKLMVEREYFMFKKQLMLSQNHCVFAQSDIEEWVFIRWLYRNYVIKNLHAQARAKSRGRSAY